jgi:hypothetical protein
MACSETFEELVISFRHTVVVFCSRTVTNECEAAQSALLRHSVDEEVSRGHAHT